MSMRSDCEEISKRRRQESVELLLGENFEERWLLVVKGAPEGCDELHCRMRLLQVAGDYTRDTGKQEMRRMKRGCRGKLEDGG